MQNTFNKFITIFQIIGNAKLNFEYVHTKYFYRYSGIYQFASPAFLLRDPELLKQITVKDFDYFTDHRTFVPENADPFWTRNLFSLKGTKKRIK